MALVELRRSFIKRTASFRKKKNLQASLKAERIKDLSDEDRDKFIEFKSKIFDDLKERHTDNVLLRFLKARSFNVEEAEKLFRLDTSFRWLLNAENNLDYVVPEVYEKYQVSGVIGFDKEGSIVRVLNLGHGDLKGMVHSISTVEIMKLLIWYIDNDAKDMRVESNRTGRKMDRVTLIVNFENMSFNQIMHKSVLDTGMQMLKTFQDHFFEMAKIVYVVNAPSFFATLYNLMRPVIQENLHRVIKVPENWREELLNIIDADVLPVYLGGKRVDCNGDPFCKDIIKFGGTIPESYYSLPGDFLDPEDPEVMSVVAQAGAYCNFKYPVFDVGTEIHLHIHAKENDIGIGLFLEPLPTGHQTPGTQNGNKREDDMSEMVPIFPIVRTQCQIAPVVRKMVAWRAGIYVLHLDNTYSWMNAKNVYFKVQLVRPERKENKY